jgi:hypothetical protein
MIARQVYENLLKDKDEKIKELKVSLHIHKYKHSLLKKKFRHNWMN